MCYVNKYHNDIKLSFNLKFFKSKQYTVVITCYELIVISLITDTFVEINNIFKNAYIICLQIWVCTYFLTSVKMQVYETASINSWSVYQFINKNNKEH